MSHVARKHIDKQKTLQECKSKKEIANWIWLQSRRPFGLKIGEIKQALGLVEIMALADYGIDLTRQF